MIEPLKTNIVHGVNKAIAVFEKDGVTIKFNKSTPEFATQVGKIVDTFIHSDKVPKTQEGLQQIAQDTFERNNNAVK